MATAPTDNTGRFTGRVEAYAAHRQGYPPEVLSEVAEHFKLLENGVFPHDIPTRLQRQATPEPLNPSKSPPTPTPHLLDLGAGTGILTLQLFDLFPNATITGIEPNEDMRAYSLSTPTLAPFLNSNRLHIADGTAESTHLPRHSVDAIFAAAAFHWFDGPAARAEALRIGRPCTDSTGQKGVPFIILTSGSVGQLDPPSDPNPASPNDAHWAAFNSTLRAKFETMGINHTAHVQAVKLAPPALEEFFGHDGWVERRSDGSRELTLEEMKRGLESYSSLPRRGSEGYERVEKALEVLFGEWQRDGRVRVVRERVAYYGLVR